LTKDNTTFYLKVALAIPINRLFDYLPEAGFQLSDYAPGMRLIVPFGRNKKTGVLISCSQQSEFDAHKLKPVLQCLDTKPLLSDLDFKLMRWAADYYQHPIGDVFAHAFPKQLRLGKPAIEILPTSYQLTEAGQSLTDDSFKRSPRQALLWSKLQTTVNAPVSEAVFADLDWDWKSTVKRMIKKGLVAQSQQTLSPPNTTQAPDFLPNKAQLNAIDKVQQAGDSFQAFLLDGVTGSGKTEVYLQLISGMLANNKQVLVLLPEITLTPQLADRFRKRLSANMVVFHSGLSDTERTQAWLGFKNGTAQIMLGTRSAVFSPAQHLGLIIMDEEHDGSFKQQEGFRYSARDVAIMRARNTDIPILLGSATPSLESLNNVRQKRFQHLILAKRAGSATPPPIRLIDIRQKKLNNHLSSTLISAIEKRIAKDEQVILFVNRRGFAPAQMCHSCGWVAQCTRCDSRLVIHQQQQRLKCHHCGADHQLPKTCPECLQDELFPLGLGTERIEQTLNQLFTGIPVIRIDRDSTRKKGSLQQAIDEIHQGGAKILVGTQMLAKGHHFPDVTLVGIIDIDAGLFSCDFRASEKMAQLVIQVAGRAGRAEKPGQVLIQTHHPDHILLNTLISSDYGHFAQQALDERQLAELPPHHFQALLRINAIDEHDVLQFLHDTDNYIHQISTDNVSILGPVPAPMLKRAGRFRYQLLIQTEDRKRRHQFLLHLLPLLEKMPSARKVRWSIDVDPQDLY